MWQSGTIYAILIECIMRKISCEIIRNFGEWFSRRCHLQIDLNSTMVAILFTEGEPFVQF